MSNTTAHSKMPKGISYIIGNEAAERFSYYGMRTILVVFMTQYLMGRGGTLDVMNEADAKAWYHMFTMAVYFFPIIGAIISDAFLGKYKTIMILSVVYCLGHLALALDETRLGLSIGLTLIAIGSGGIKPAVSAHVGDQFNAAKKHLLDKVFSYFYFAINFGSFISTLLTPVTLKYFGPHVAFGIPGILMFLATIVFWMGRHVFIAVPARGFKNYVADIKSPQGRKALTSLPLIYLFVAIFWSLYDQTGSSWVLQAKHMDRMVDFTLGGVLPFDWLRFEILPSQIQAINPILVMAFIPIFSLLVYPAINRFFPLTALRKISIGLFITAISFCLIALAESRIQTGANVSILWQLSAFIIITAAEVMVSITCLEFSYMQAPHSMKSLVMGLYLLSTSLGNAITAFINFFIQNEDGSLKLAGAEYYWFFAGLMLVTALLFIGIAIMYKEENYIQSHEGLRPSGQDNVRVDKGGQIAA